MATIKTPEKPDTALPEAEPSQAPATPPVKRGKIALVWNPANDPDVPGTVVGSRAIRIFTYCVIEGYYQQQIAGRNETAKVPHFKSLTLNLIGRNWVDNELWQRAKAQSKANYEQSIQNGDGAAYDAIARLLKAGAIREFEPIVDQLTGTLSDYSEADAQILVQEVFDADLLRGEMKAEVRGGLAQYIQGRIKDLEAGEIGRR
jgi:hypothetical protein